MTVMHFTGERAMPLEPGTHPKVMREHWARYEFVVPLVSGKRVLDIACGVGYGTDLLAQNASSVIGGDISKETIAYCQDHYRRDNLIFETMDARSIPYPDQSFDVITSFETIEHITEGGQFLKETARLLANGGTLILSTPLGEIPGENPYHLAHYQIETFKPYLLRFFKDVTVLFQHGDMFQENPLSPSYGLAICQIPRRASVSIIIPVFNQLEYTRLCLESIKVNTPEQYELIIIDNGSTDGTADYLNNYLASHSNVWIIRNESNLGYAPASNQGIARASGEYILLLNNDTIVSPGWLGRMLAVFEKYPDVGLVGPVSNYASGWQWIRGIESAYHNPDEMAAFAVKWANQHNNKSREVKKLIGFCLLAPRRLYEQVGNLDERFGLGNFDDDDFCLRTQLKGYRARVALDTFIHHQGHATFAGLDTPYRDLVLKNWELFKAKWNIPTDLVYGDDYFPYVNLPRRATVGVAMMARNAETDIPLALGPFKGKVDQIAIVLGGKSTDATAEVARQWADIVTEYDGPVDDDGSMLDFARAQQQAFDLLSTDWAIKVDTDERWTGIENLGVVLDDAIAGEHRGVMFPFDLGASRFLAPRLYQRDAGRWMSPIHEYFLYHVPPDGCILTTDKIKIRQEKPAGSGIKSIERNIRIAERHLNDSFDFRLLMHLSREYLLVGRYQEAVDTAQRYLDGLGNATEKEATPDKLFQIHFVRGMAFLCLEDYEAATGATLTALNYASYGHGWALLAEIAYQMGVYHLVLFAADQAIAHGRPLDTLPTPYANVSYVPLHLKAKALAALGRKHEAIIALDLGLALKSDEQEIINFKYQLCNELGVIP